jgi:lysophospholipase L1-like esterase
MTAKTILAFGDSLTWGMNANTLSRHAHEDLWPSVLEARLGGGARVINAGLNGRTTMFDDYGVSYDRNGARILPTILATFEPIDLVIIMLGANDMKTFVNGSAIAAAQGVTRLIEIIRSFNDVTKAPAPEVIVVSPPRVDKIGPHADFPMLSPRTDESKQLAAYYAMVAEKAGCAFFDAATVATTAGGKDGVHLDAANTRAIGDALAPVAATILGIKLASTA